MKINHKIKSILVRYLILLVIGLPNLYLFYLVFTPLTIYPTFFILNLIDSSTYFVKEVSDTIFFKGYYASIIPACVAGAAYYLLLIFNLTTPMKLNKRLISISYLFLAFLLLNLLRISFFALLLSKGYQYFDLTHRATWYFGSTIIVLLIWFSNVIIFKINSIPVYTDIKFLVKNINPKDLKHKK